MAVSQHPSGRLQAPPPSSLSDPCSEAHSPFLYRIPIPWGIIFSGPGGRGPDGAIGLPSRTGSFPPQPHTFKPQISLHPRLEGEVFSCKFKYLKNLTLSFSHLGLRSASRASPLPLAGGLCLSCYMLAEACIFIC